MPVLLATAPSANNANEMIHEATYIVDDVRLDVLFTRAFRILGTDNVNLVVFVGHIATIHVDDVVGVVDAKSTKRETKGQSEEWKRGAMGCNRLNNAHCARRLVFVLARLIRFSQ